MRPDSRYDRRNERIDGYQRRDYRDDRRDREDSPEKREDLGFDFMGYLVRSIRGRGDRRQ